jgi:hypothetical protein
MSLRNVGFSQNYTSFAVQKVCTLRRCDSWWLRRVISFEDNIYREGLGQACEHLYQQLTLLEPHNANES